AREMEELGDALVPTRGFGFDIESPLGKPAFELDFGDTSPAEQSASASAFEVSTDFNLSSSDDAGSNAFDLFGAPPVEADTPAPASQASGSTVDSGPIMSDAALRDELE